MTNHHATWGHPTRKHKPPLLARWGWAFTAALAVLMIAGLAHKALPQAAFDSHHFQNWTKR